MKDKRNDDYILPTPGDTVLIALMSELRRIGILSSKEMLNIVVTYMDLSVGTPVMDNPGYAPMMLCLMAIANDPELNSIIDKKFPGLRAKAIKAQKERSRG